MTLRRFFNLISWSIFSVLLVPTVLILASWNAIPGDRMYGVKRGLENAILIVVSPSYAYQGDLKNQFTKRRLDEVQRSIATHNLESEVASASLLNLQEQVSDTAATIRQVQDAERQRQIAQNYLETLRETQQVLVEQRERAQAPAPTAPITGQPQTPPIGQVPTQPEPAPGQIAPQPTPTQPTQPQAPPPTDPAQVPTPAPAQPQPTQAPAQPVPTPAQAAQPAPNKLVEAEQTVEETIKEVEEIIRSLPAQSQGVGVPGGGRDRDGGGQAAPRQEVELPQPARNRPER